MKKRVILEVSITRSDEENHQVYIFGFHCVAKNIQENVLENRVVCRPEELFCRPTDSWIWWSEFVFIVVLSELIDNLY
jgi:hypothetical protein